MSDIPAIGSVWQHTNGNVYRVILITNIDSTRLDKYPVTVSYHNIYNGKDWSRKLSDWGRSMTLIEEEYNND